MTDGRFADAQATVESAITEGEAHISRMEKAACGIASEFPLTAQTLASLPDGKLALLDQLIYRFMKLQDSMASRLLPSLHALLRVDESPRPFLDILSYLEKVGALSSEADWSFFRALRNNLAHDYPEAIEQTVETLNTLFERWRDLKRMFEQARDFHRRSVA